MKKLYPIVCLAALMLAGACKKDNLKGDKTLTGKWKIAGSMISSGGPMYYVAPTNKNLYVQFNSDGTLGGDAFSDYKTFKIKDSTMVTFTKADNKTYENFIYRFRNDTLSLGMAGPIYCTEGCATLFTR